MSSLTQLLRSRTQTLRHLYAFGVGTAAGASIGLVGWGGAQVIVPSMTVPFSFAGYSQFAATGISLTSLSLSTVSSGYQFWHEDRVNIPIALAIGVPSVLSARLGVHLATRLSGDVLALAFNAASIVLIPTHYWIQERAKRRRATLQQSKKPLENAEQCTETDGTSSEESTVSSSHPDTGSMLQHACFGMISGTISAIMGVGGLPLSMSYMTEATDLPHHFVQGTAVCALLPSILTSAISRIHAIPPGPAGFVALGAMVGAYGGAKGALTLSEEQLRQLYMGSLVVFGGRSAFGAARNIQRILSKAT